MRCSVSGCTTKANISKNANPMFFTFPIISNVRQKWIEALKLDTEPPPTFLVCSLHFATNDFKLDKSIRATAVPSFYLPTRCKSPQFQSEISKKQLPKSFYDYQKQFALTVNLDHLQLYNENGKRKSLESDFKKSCIKQSCTNWTPEHISNYENLHAIGIPVISKVTSLQSIHHTRTDENIPIIDLDDYPDNNEQMGIAPPNLLETDHFEDVDEIGSFLTTNSKSTQTQFPEQGVFSQKQIEYFTGLKPNRYEFIINLIKRENIKLTYDHISLHDQILLTLFRYRHNCDFQLMQYIFKVKLEYLLTIFKECSNALYIALSKINLLSTSKLNKGSNIIVDSTNFVVEQTANECHMKLLMSSENDQPKFKLLVACDENALIVFISDAYGNAMPNRELFVRSEFTRNILNDQQIILCKDFNADDILESNGIKVRHKPFLKENNFATEEIVALNAIEELIRNIKKYKILCEPIPVIFWPFANKLIKNCFYLNNLRNEALNTIVMLR